MLIKSFSFLIFIYPQNLKITYLAFYYKSNTCSCIDTWENYIVLCTMIIHRWFRVDSLYHSTLWKDTIWVFLFYSECKKSTIVPFITEFIMYVTVIHSLHSSKELSDITNKHYPSGRSIILSHPWERFFKNEFAGDGNVLTSDVVRMANKKHIFAFQNEFIQAIWNFRLFEDP